MQAIIMTAIGAPEVLQLQTLPDPPIAAPLGCDGAGTVKTIGAASNKTVLDTRALSITS